MAYGPITKRHVVLGAANSNLTGATVFVGDLRQISLSIYSSTASASRYTVVGSNLDGFTTALGAPLQTGDNQEWSVVTAVTSNGIYTVDPGIRWLTAFRDGISVSAASNTTITIAGRT